jgi:acyl-CoA thioester hydrolase
MGEWRESYRGVVHPWECDMVEHFTVAYYFDRFSDAVLGQMEAIGLGASYMEETGRGCATVDCYVRYLEELRAGDSLHIESAVIGGDDKRITLGHKVYNSSTGAPVATLEQLLLHFDMEKRKALPFSAAQRGQIEALKTAWDGEPRLPRHSPESHDGFAATARDTVKPWEVDVLGHMGFQFFVHRFTAASMQTMSRIGLSQRYMSEHRYGFSTFEFQLRFLRELSAGDLLEVRTGLMHLGGSSMRMLHRLFNLRSGELSAELSQYGVLLDTDARRPTRVPEHVREIAAGMVIGEPAA